MILPSTLRKLQQQGQQVVRLVIPAHVLSFPASADGITPAQTINVPETRDYFTTTKQALHLYESRVIPGLPIPAAQIDSIPAKALDWLTGREF